MREGERQGKEERINEEWKEGRTEGKKDCANKGRKEQRKKR